MVRCELSESGDKVELSIHGVADVANAASLKEQLSSIDCAGRDVVVVLDGLERLDGAGVQLLVALKAYVGRSAANLTIVAAAEAPRSALEIAGALEVLAVRRP